LCLCPVCDKEYDSINKDANRVEWLNKNGFIEQAEKLKRTSIKMKGWNYYYAKGSIKIKE